MRPAPQRVLLLGVTGSGKTTAARRIGAAIGIRATLIDELSWRPGWQLLGDDEQRAAVLPLLATSTWVIDAVYSAWREEAIARADLIVGLVYPRTISLARLIRRTTHRLLSRELICNGNVESLLSVFGRDSILAWHFRSFTRKRDEIRSLAAHHPDRVVVMRRPAELDAWLATLTP